MGALAVIAVIAFLVVYWKKKKFVQEPNDEFHDGAGVTAPPGVGGGPNAGMARVTPFNAYEQPTAQPYGVDMRQQYPGAWKPGPSFGFTPMVLPVPEDPNFQHNQQGSDLSATTASTGPPMGFAGVGTQPVQRRRTAQTVGGTSSTSRSSYSQPSSSGPYGKEREAYGTRRVTNASVASTEDGRGQEVVVPPWSVPGTSGHVRSPSATTGMSTSTAGSGPAASPLSTSAFDSRRRRSMPIM